MIYDVNYVFKELYFFKKLVIYCFINIKIIVEVLSNFIWVGIGDVLLKEYECIFLLRGDKLDYINFLGVDISCNCVELFLKYGKKVYEDFKFYKVLDELE